MKNKSGLQFGFSDILVIMITAAVFIALQTYLCVATGINPAVSGIFVFSVYAAIVFTYTIYRRGKQHRSGLKPVPEVSVVLADAVINSPELCILCPEGSKKIVWLNKAATELFAKERTKSFDELLSPAEGYVEGEVYSRGDRLFACKTHTCRGSDENTYTVYTLEDITRRELLENSLRGKECAVAYIVVDNLDELMNFEQEDYRGASGKTEQLLRQWASGAGGVLKEYQQDKYIFVFEKSYLAEFTAHGFDILDKIRAVRMGDSSLPVTVSIGISAVGASILEKEKNARNALDTALQRGGDQVVIKGEGTLDIFGGKTKMPQKRTRVKARVIANELVLRITEAENVLIMFHKYGDFDAFGSAVGLARLVMFCGVPVNIVTDPGDVGLAKSLEWLRDEADYSGMFIDSAAALDLVSSKTLLIITDVNNKDQFECPVLAAHCRDTVIIDHHRKTADFEREPVITYIEPGASAASELVAEMLEQVLPIECLLPREADLMMAGILLDTNQFTKSTGTRTFSAALYLRSAGADLGEVQEFFKTELEDFQRELRFHSNVEIYRGIAAIATAEGTCEIKDKVPAAKAANRLLTVEGVKASFAIVPIGGEVHISARSSGTINVQLLLEGLRGGGHYDAAGTRIPGVTAKEAEGLLKAAIDKYLDEAQSDKPSKDKEIKK